MRHALSGPTPATEALPSLEQAWLTARSFLSSELQAGAHWTGELSTSALSTATAISALAAVQLARQQRASAASDACTTHSADMIEAISQGCTWLLGQQNADGGFGDTHRSHSNIATTLLVLAAWELARQALSASQQSSAMDAMWDTHIARSRAAAWSYAERHGMWDGLRQRYGKDKTFVVPILSNCALAGMVPWKNVPALPFEAAWLPQEWYRWVRLPVVSYAIPALVAIGQARFHHAPPRNPLLAALRRRAIAPSLQVLRSMQPASGGYLEATPLTSFVLMNLASMGRDDLPVAEDCLRFLLESRLADGSWPIDTNLATWVTSLSINALAQRQERCADRDAAVETPDELPPLVTPATIQWLLGCQHRQRHPFTGANPGGWGWTNLSGAVPDADDTPAALLALSHIPWQAAAWQALEPAALEAVGQGLQWLMRLQNRDGGWPTFCRGWGTLPFDRSGTDLTAHALRAIQAWLPRLDEVNAAVQRSAGRQPELTHGGLSRAQQRGLAFLQRQQQADGSWLPLWFGNQDRPAEDNPVYGTGRVLLAYAALGLAESQQAKRGIRFLQETQNADGGWGGGASVRYQGSRDGWQSTIEETSVALEGLLWCGQPPHNASIMQALRWLAETIQQGNLSCSWPIGFYFAKLWYHERLYPAIFSLGALGTALALSQTPPRESRDDFRPSL